MYPAAERVSADKTQEPEDDEDDRDGPKHLVVLPLVRLALTSAVRYDCEAFRPPNDRLRSRGFRLSAVRTIERFSV